MKKIIFPLILILFQLGTYAQVKETITQNRADQAGLKNKKDFEQPPFDQWFNQNYNDYELDEKLVKEIKKNFKGITIKAVMGTWCEDSRIETPRFYKLLDTLNFDYQKLTMIAVNRVKKTPDNLQEGLNIIRVPTFIFYRNNEEIGRFVEYPKETLENDILKIVSGQPYKHSYEK